MEVETKFFYSSCLKYLKTDIIIGIKHVFPCINIRWVPREVFKTEGAARGFQHRPRNPANVKARKTCLIAIIA